MAQAERAVTWRKIAEKMPDFVQWVAQTCGSLHEGEVNEDEFARYRAAYNHRNDRRFSARDLLFQAGTELIHQGHHALGEAVLEVADTLAGGSNGTS